MLSLTRAFGLRKLASNSTSRSASSTTPSSSTQRSQHRNLARINLSQKSVPVLALQKSFGAELSSFGLCGRIVHRQYASAKKAQQKLPKISRDSNITGVAKFKSSSQYREEEDIDDEEGADYPYLDAQHDGSVVPETLAEPMEVVKLPKQRHTFNYKTYRYKDVQYDDDRVSASMTITASKGPQVRLGEQPGEVIMHTKENPGEDLSKDAIAEIGEIPLGLDAVPVSYNRQMMNAIYEILKEEHGEDIVTIDIGNKTNWVPTMIIVTATSARHCVALAGRVAAELKRTKLCRSPKIERNVGDEWALVSAGVVVVEIMTAEQREYMDLERLWVLKKSSAETFEFDEEEERFMYDDEDGMWDEDDL